MRYEDFFEQKYHHYRPQWSWGKVMFLHLSVILFTGGISHTFPGRHPSPQADTAPSVQCMLGYGQQAGGTHPTGMQCCFKSKSDNRLLKNNNHYKNASQVMNFTHSKYNKFICTFEILRVWSMFLLCLYTRLILHYPGHPYHCPPDGSTSRSHTRWEQ